MHLRPVALGTTQTSFFQTGQNNIIISDPCAEGPAPPIGPVALHPDGWDDNRVAVGHVAKKRGGKWFECWKFQKVTYQGAMQFDLRTVIAAADFPPTREVNLLFDLDNSGGFGWASLAHDPHPCSRIWIFESSEVVQPGLFRVPRQPSGTVIGGPGHGEVHFKLPVTENVNRLIREAHHISAEPSNRISFLLSAENLGRWDVDPDPKQCLGRYRNFVLEVKLASP
jgi:hypothetical protein